MAFPVDNLALLQKTMQLAHVRHSADPRVHGRFSNAYQLWRKLYEARAALNDSNPAWAARLLPTIAPLAMPVLGLPAVPTGILSLVDAAKPGTVSLTINVAGTLTLVVSPPGGGPVFNPTVTPGATQQTSTFLADVDGIYPVQIKAGGSTIATVYIGVFRALNLKFRQLSRELAYDFDSAGSPPAYDAYSELLAILYALDAALATGQLVIARQLLAAADQVEAAPTPTALFPHNGC